ncbi:MAG: sporulation protein YqfD, partial [Clostridia bacterium]|nr:sporulation protein YqfD [Clostridia bacterium]
MNQLIIVYKIGESSLFKRFMMFMKGYLKIRIQGCSPERFLNLCNHKCIYLWEIRRINDCYEAYVYVEDFRKIKQIVKKTRTCVRILEREGFPFFLYRYKNRKLFFAGIVIAILILYVLSLYIWQIEISQNVRITDDQILRLLSEYQIEPGIKKSELDCQLIEKMIRKEFDEVVWAAASQDGARLLIMINENETAQKKEEMPKSQDIYAPYAGKVL